MFVCLESNIIKSCSSIISSTNLTTAIVCVGSSKYPDCDFDKLCHGVVLGVHLLRGSKLQSQEQPTSITTTSAHKYSPCYSEPSSNQATNSSTTVSTGIMLGEASVVPPSTSTSPPGGMIPPKLLNTSLKASSSPPKGPNNGVA